MWKYEAMWLDGTSSAVAVSPRDIGLDFTRGFTSGYFLEAASRLNSRRVQSLFPFNVRPRGLRLIG